MGEENGNKKKKTKLTIGVSLEAYSVIKDLLETSKEFKTLKDVASDFILWSNLAVKKAVTDKEEALKKVDWLQTDVDRLTGREKTLVQEGKSARAALGVLEDKYGALRFILALSYVIFGTVVGVYWILSA